MALGCDSVWLIGTIREHVSQLAKDDTKDNLKVFEIGGDFQESFMLIFLSQSENPCSNVDTLTSSETFDEPGLSNISKAILKSLQNDCNFQVVTENA